MANVHNIRIRGRLPFDIIEKGSERVVRMFARMSSPSWGLHIEYGKETYKPVPDTHGEYTFYDFTIFGSEAVWEDDIIRFCIDLVKTGAEITDAFVEDIEFPVPEHSIMELIVLGDNFEKLMKEDHKKTEKYVEELMKTRKWVERKIGEGISEHKLVKKE